VEVPYFLNKYDPDALRFYPTATALETRDTEFSWEDFVERNNNELVATWGNLANRLLSFAYKRFDGRVPEPRPLDDEDRALLAKLDAEFETVGELYDACKFRAAPSALLRAGLGEALAPPKALTRCDPRGLTRSVSPGSRSRRIRPPQRRVYTSRRACAPWTT
jgi:hypothetical protein